MEREKKKKRKTIALAIAKDARDECDSKTVTTQVYLWGMIGSAESAVEIDN